MIDSILFNSILEKSGIDKWKSIAQWAGTGNKQKKRTEPKLPKLLIIMFIPKLEHQYYFLKDARAFPFKIGQIFVNGAFVI